MPDSHRLPCYALTSTPESLPNLPDSFRQALISIPGKRATAAPQAPELAVRSKARHRHGRDIDTPERLRGSLQSKLSASHRRSTAGLSCEFALEIPDRVRGDAVAALEHTRDTLRLVDRTRPVHAHAGSLEQPAAWYNSVRPKVPAQGLKREVRCNPGAVPPL